MPALRVGFGHDVVVVCCPGAETFGFMSPDEGKLFEASKREPTMCSSYCQDTCRMKLLTHQLEDTLLLVITVAFR